MGSETRPSFASLSDYPFTSEVNSDAQGILCFSDDMPAWRIHVNMTAKPHRRTGFREEGVVPVSVMGEPAASDA